MQMKMFLTRLGFGQGGVTGDVTHIDPSRRYLARSRLLLVRGF